MKRILITGGAGFVGSSLATRFRKEFPEADIICLDNLYRKGAELNRERITRAGIKFIKGDVRYKASFDIPACDLVVDAAAEPSVTAGNKDDCSYVVDTNLVGTLNTLEAAKKWSAKLLFLSTSRVYPVESLKNIALDDSKMRFEIAKTQTLPGITSEGISESFPLMGARTLYGATKFASEIMVAEYASQFGLQTLINRCGVLAGPWQMGKVDQGVVALWIAAHHYHRPLRYIGYNGKQVRDTLHIDDFGDLIMQQLEKSSVWDGRAYAVGGGIKVSVSLQELTVIASETTGNNIKITSEPSVRSGDIPLYITDCTKVRGDFNWNPQRMVKDIAVDIGRWITENEDVLRPIFC